MKKTYQKPNADVLVFCPAESLAIVWEDLNAGSFAETDRVAASTLSTDINIVIKK